MPLSPAFSSRTAEDAEFLRRIDGTTGFALFWIDVVRPLLDAIDARAVLEIGADRGEHTRHLAGYCDARGGHLTVIDPCIGDEVRAIASTSPRVTVIEERTQVALPRLDARLDAVLLEGDLNFATVRGDLAGIDDVARRTGTTYPVVFVKNTSWPYARRDMYYDPAALSPEDRHPYRRSGVSPWHQGLVPGLINDEFANAAVEGGTRNGVLSAVEDFLQHTQRSLAFLSIPLNHGLGIIYTVGSRAEEFVHGQLAPPPALSRLMETVEIARVNDILMRLEPRPPAAAPSSVFGRGRRVLARVRARITS